MERGCQSRNIAEASIGLPTEGDSVASELETASNTKNQHFEKRYLAPRKFPLKFTCFFMYGPRVFCTTTVRNKGLRIVGLGRPNFFQTNPLNTRSRLLYLKTVRTA